jgi:thymidylate synthase
MVTEINARTISDAWVEVLRSTLRGVPTKVIASGTERMTLEHPNVVLTNINMPFVDMIPQGSKFCDQGALEAYAMQLQTGNNLNGFEYTYGERLRKYGDAQIDQIDLIIKHLQQNPESRQAIAITWRPMVDAKRAGDVPCMLLCDFVIRQGQLNLTVYFRSHDIYGAFPSNAYGLARLMETVARFTGNEVGRLSIISNKAHIYDTDLAAARMVTGCPA